MEAKEILKAHVAKIATLTDEQFDHFFSFFTPRVLKKGNRSSVRAMRSIANIL